MPTPVPRRQEFVTGGGESRSEFASGLFVQNIIAWRLDRGRPRPQPPFTLGRRRTEPHSETRGQALTAGGGVNSSAWYELRTIGPLATWTNPISRAI